MWTSPPGPLNPLTKNTFLAHFVTKTGPFGRFGMVRGTPAPLLATGLDLYSTFVMVSDLEIFGVTGSKGPFH